MNILRAAILATTLSLPVAVGAAVSADNLPGNTVWYLHADLDAMRNSDSGGMLYDWFQGEVVVEVNDKLNIDINKEVDSVTAFTDAQLGTVVVVDGPLRQDSKDKLLALVSLEQKIDPRDHRGKDYFFMGSDEDDGPRGDEPFDDLEDAAYFSFDLKNRAIITGNEEQMKALLDNNGEIVGGGGHDGALFVISADKSFVQGGLRTDKFSDGNDEDGWESNILRNTEQAALLVSDASGRIAVEAQLVSTDPKMAQAIGGIVNGLIGLQLFNSELGPEIQGLIRNTKVEVQDNILSINMVVDPDVVLSMLND